jgi:hypothetical protein
LSQLDARLQRLAEPAGTISSSHADAQGKQTSITAPHQSASPPATAEQQPAQRVLVVRIDHMHNRALYTRTLRAWMADLGITGALSTMVVVAGQALSCTKQGPAADRTGPHILQASYFCPGNVAAH